MLHKIKVNKEILTKKPEAEEAGRISKSITTLLEVDIKEFSKIVVQPYCWTWTACNFEGRRIKQNFISQSIFYLDFDNGTSLEEIKSSIDEIGLRANVIYNTLSDTQELRKFRVVFFLNALTKCPKTATWIQSNLIKMFPEADSACGTPERMIYGGWSIQHFDEIENDFEDFIKIINSHIVSCDRLGENYHTRGMKSYELNSDDEFSIIWGQTPSAVEHNIEEITKFDWNSAFKDIKILRDFHSGIRLKHMEIFGLATNLMWIRGGLTYMKNKMLEVNRNENRVDRFNKKAKPYIHQQFATLPQVKKMRYKPQYLEKFSPYSEDWEINNIIENMSWKRGRVDILATYETIPLKEAELKLENEFKRRVLEINSGATDGDIFDSLEITPSFEKEITIFKVATGLGKTRQLERVGKAILATKTNALKRELSGRMKVKHEMTPDYPQFSNPLINEVIVNLIESNLYEESSNIIKKISEGKSLQIGDKIWTPDSSDILLAVDYRGQNAVCRETPYSVITTHHRALFDDALKHDTIIFDECPLDTLVSIASWRFNFHQFDGTEFKDISSDIERWCRDDIGFSQIVETKSFVISNYSKFCQVCAASGESGLIKLLQSDYVFRDSRQKGLIHFAEKKQLPNKNIVIMSATSPVEIYKYLFGSRVKIVDISNVEREGKIIQYTKKSWSRSSFNSASNDVIKKLVEEIGELPVITFKEFRKVFKNPIEIYFGNTLGYDEWGGLDLAIVGTDNKPIWCYFFYAKLVGKDLKAHDNLLDVRLVDWNNMRFKSMTFENPILRNIQLSMIETEQLQSVGRGRSVRFPNTIYLHSSQPLRGCDEYIY